ncbi:MAG: TIGR00341 family protein [Planctomycetota bacterium]
MVQRIVEIVTPSDAADKVRRFLAARDADAAWELAAADGKVVFRVLCAARDVEEILDPLQTVLATTTGARMVVLPVEAVVPRVEADDASGDGGDGGERLRPDRLSREELLQEIRGASRITPTYLVTVVLSSVVAAIGLARGSPAIIIGAMVVAPLLGPNMALSLGIALGDGVLARSSLRANAAGVGLAFALAVLFGFIIQLPLDNPEVVARVAPDLADVALALAAGTAGALAFTSNVLTSLVGVMVAVALLPPLVVFGMLLANGEFSHAVQALLLLAVNVVCVLLAAVTTFLLQGIGPRQWWQARAARQRALYVIGLLVVLLAALAAAFAR